MNEQKGTQAVWLPAYATLVGAVAALIDAIVDQVSWWHLILATVVACVVTFMVTAGQEAARGGKGWASVLAHRLVTVLAAGGWATWSDITDWASPVLLSGAVGLAALTALGLVCQSPVAQGRLDVPPPALPAIRDISPATPRGPSWQTVIRTVTQMKTATVVNWEPWEDKRDGLRLTVALPADSGATAAEIAPRCGNLAAGARLDQGCNVRVLDSGQQGVVIVDVALRNVLADSPRVHVEPTAPASINDEFPVLTTPRGDLLSICLRISSMVVGGTTGSGKTTLLHRLIMWLARCTDTLVWVVDLNGGGVADPWVSPWMEGRAQAPVVDWVAASEEEAAVMVAVARAVAVDRKSNVEAKRRKRDANDMVLPVDARMPAIVVLTDEGGEVRQSSSVFGQLASQGVSRLAQIGRAEGIRTIMSVLRGTADLTDKALRIVSAIRLCLRMEEHDEYGHVLGSDPGKTQLEGAVGVGFLRTAKISRPVLGRTVNVDLKGIDGHAVACASLRPSLDEWALRAASRVNGKSVLGRDPAREHLVHQAMRDAERGLAYAGRWDRYRTGLSLEPGEEAAAVPTAAGGGAATPGLAAMIAATAAIELPVTDKAPTAKQSADAPPAATGNVIQLFGNRAPEPAAATSARERILSLVAAAGPAGISSADIARRTEKARSHVMDVLKQLRGTGEVTKNDTGRYVASRVGSQDSAG